MNGPSGCARVTVVTADLARAGRSAARRTRAAREGALACFGGDAGGGAPTETAGPGCASRWHPGPDSSRGRTARRPPAGAV